jgi:hypothetical protein
MVEIAPTKALNSAAEAKRWEVVLQGLGTTVEARELNPG